MVKKRRSHVERAEEADRRGRRVGITVKDYERLARRGPRRLAEALIARHNIRMKNLMQLPQPYRVGAIESLGPIGVLDHAHQTLGIGLGRIPRSTPERGREISGGESIAQLRQSGCC